MVYCPVSLFNACIVVLKVDGIRVVIIATILNPDGTGDFLANGHQISVNINKVFFIFTKRCPIYFA
jgi:hypothetical protein